ncbi:MAG: Gfo/Idh/MocA family oxidoreductase [Candidatus Latescibacterota bacterium]
MAEYRAGVIGLGWMGLLYDLAERIPDRFEVDDAERPTPPLDVHRRTYHHQHPGSEGLPNSYAEALWDRPEVDLVAGADRDARRLQAFGERYGIRALYKDAEEMLRRERLEIVAIATNTKGRADLTCLAVECGARGILTDKPMAHTLAEADRMVQACAGAGVPLSCGAISTTHPSFARAREILESGAIGELVSLQAPTPCAQHQAWSYFLRGAPAWVVGTGDPPRRESGSDEFCGQGMLVTAVGETVHFDRGHAHLRLNCTRGEITFDYTYRWHLVQELETRAGRARVEVPWPEPQMVFPYGAVYSLADVVDCLTGKLDEPKNSGRRVAVALEVEVALKLSSARGGVRVDLPLADRSLGLHYDWFR